jgi:hypothetical protein
VIGQSKRLIAKGKINKLCVPPSLSLIKMNHTIISTHSYFSRTMGQRVQIPAKYPPVLSWRERERERERERGRVGEDTAQH